MYRSFYGLTAKPFNLTPDPRFFFNSRAHKRALAYLRYGIKQGEGFIIVTGDVGTGKTMLVSTLFQSLSRDNVIGAQIVTTQMQADDLLRMVAAGFDLPYQRVTKAAILRSLESYFRSVVDEGKRVLLVVDEAQGLPRRAIEELRMLSNFTYKGRSLLQSFLLGQREFRTTMRSEGFEQLRQRVIAAYHLRPLDAEETRGYIEHRLKLVGWKGDPAFQPEVFEGIHQFTGGVPRRINTLADRLLLYGYLEELHTIDVKALDSVASDIIEEQGGTTGAYAKAGGLAGVNGVDYEEEGEGDDHRAASDASRARRPTPGPDPTDQRLQAVESNMASLTDAVRQELSLLRQALLGSAAGKPASASEHDGAAARDESTGTRDKD
ncbi:MAG: AAA family ATPase [Ectothiorhodospiraceae bacterium]|nr:AAA family ATPase [Ectothiorhodospiraceae bacterium]